MAGAAYTSKRGYLSQDDLAEYANIEIEHTDEADDQISQAEEMIDDYVGFQDKFYKETLNGKASAVSGSTFTLDLPFISSFSNTVDFFKNMHVEIIGGTGAGQIRKISGSSIVGVLTVESAFSPAIDTTSIYKIYQLGKFPRQKDVFFNGLEYPGRMYKSIPDDVKRAVAAQVQYVINMGDAFFASDGEETSETIDNYSITRKKGGGFKSLIAPKARHLLRGITNRTGAIVI